MSLVSLTRRIREGSIVDNLRFACGRFASVRAGYGAIRALAEKKTASPDSEPESLIEPFDFNAAISGLRHQSVYHPIRLSHHAVAALMQLAIEEPIRSPLPTEPFIRYAEVFEYNRRNRELPFLYGRVPSAENNPTVLKIVNDPQILETARRYLGYLPLRRRLRLQWSFVCEAPADQRMARGQTVRYHYDSDDFNFLYTMFYLTETDADSGAHVMIPGTHRTKPLSWLFGRTWRTDEEVFARYPRSSELLLAGPPGFGFIQDSSCLHKAWPPIKRPRLVLQIRYS